MSEYPPMIINQTDGGLLSFVACLQIHVSATRLSTWIRVWAVSGSASEWYVCIDGVYIFKRVILCIKVGI